MVFRRPRRFNNTTAGQIASYNDRVNDPSLKDRLEKLLANPLVAQQNYTVEFLKSLLEQYNSRGSLSHNQVASLEKSEAKFTDESAAEQIASLNAWKVSFDQEKQTKIKKIAKWYKQMAESFAQPYYYRDVCENVLNREDYIPSEIAYKKIVENKYSETFLVESEKAPKFSLGEAVCLSSASNQNIAGRLIRKDMKEIESYIVLEVTDIVKPVRGGRIYRLLTIGDDKIVQIEERFLKKSR